MKCLVMFWTLASGAMVAVFLAALWSSLRSEASGLGLPVPGIASTQDSELAPAAGAQHVVNESGPLSRVTGLVDAPAQIGAPGHTVFGRVLTAGGVPAEGVGIALSPRFEVSSVETRDAYTELLGGEHRYLHARTSGDGSYCFEGVPGFRYDFRLDEVPDDQCSSGVRIESDHEQNFELPPGVRFGGTVSVAGGGGVAISVEMDRCSLPDLGFGPGLGDHRAISTRAGASFVMEGLQPGLYQLRVAAEGYASIHRSIELVQSRLGERLELAKGLTLSGRVDIGFQTRRQDATFWLEPSLPGSWLFNDWEEGAFHLDDCAPGVYDLTVRVQATKAGTSDVERTFRFHLDEDMEGLVLPMNQDPLPTSIKVERPETNVWVDGWLTATCGHERIRRLIRLVPKVGDHSHQWWDAARRRFRRSGVLDLPLKVGTWELQLEIPGYRDWSHRVEVTEARADPIVAALEPRPGSLVDVDIKGPYLVEVRRSGGQHPWRTLLDHSAAQAKSSTIDGLMSAWLAPGTYDLRIETPGHVEDFLEGVQVGPNSVPLVLRTTETPGLTIQGTVESNVQLDLGFAFYLWRKGGDTWDLKRSKVSGIRSEYELKTIGFQFRFQGLVAGDYRATLDEAGVAPVAEWTLTDMDLASEHVVHHFLP